MESNQLSSAYKAVASPAMLKGRGAKRRILAYKPRTLESSYTLRTILGIEVHI